MRTSLCSLGIVMITMVTVFAVSGCQPLPGVTINGEGTGGGGIARADGTRATFTFHGSSCGFPDVPASGRFNFIDKNPEGAAFDVQNGVMADGTVTGFTQCDTAGGCLDPGISPDPCPQGGYMFTFDYRNKNSKVPAGTGTGAACVVDNGEGNKAAIPDFAAIGFETGPYAGYQTHGDVNGNIQGHFCD